MITRHAGLAASLATALTMLSASAFAQTTSDTGTAGTSTTAASPGGTPAGSLLNDTDKLFLLRSAQGDMAEVSTSQMALKKAKDSGVKQIAQRLVTDHSQSLKEGSGLAVLLGQPMPKDPGIMNLAFAQQLRSAGGKDFDKLYMAGQVEAHENTVALYNMELSQGQDPQVKAFASKYLPGIEAHTGDIYQIARTVAAPDSSLRPATPPMVAGVPASSSMSGSMGTSGTSTSGTSTSGTSTSGMSTSGTNTSGTSTSGMNGGAGAGTPGGGAGAGTPGGGAGAGTPGGGAGAAGQ